MAGVISAGRAFLFILIKYRLVGKMYLYEFKMNKELLERVFLVRGKVSGIKRGLICIVRNVDR